MDLKPGDLVLVKADTFQGKRKIEDRWEDEPHKVVRQIMTDIPLYQSDGPYVDSHMSYTANDFYSLCQKLAFPCVWVSAKHRTDVPAPTLVKPTP